MLSLAQSHQHCREVTKKHAKSFYFASVRLPAVKKKAAYSVYALCRHIDDSVDERAPDEDIEPILVRLKDDLDELWAESSTAPYAPALKESIERYGIPREPWDDLLKGVGMDRGEQGEVRMKNWEELYEYCYHVASVVGLILCPVFGLDEKDDWGRERAVDLGVAMQLTNIIRDVGEDYQMKRIYLPVDEMLQYGVSENDLSEKEVSEGLKRLLKFQVQRAREHYSLAEEGIARLSKDGSAQTVRLMSRVYADILKQVEKNDYQVLANRAHTNAPRKLYLAAKALLK